MNGILSISVTKDMMHATLSIEADEKNALTKEYILGFLKDDELLIDQTTSLPADHS